MHSVSIASQPVRNEKHFKVFNKIKESKIEEEEYRLRGKDRIRRQKILFGLAPTDSDRANLLWAIGISLYVRLSVCACVFLCLLGWYIYTLLQHISSLQSEKSLASGMWEMYSNINLMFLLMNKPFFGGALIPLDITRLKKLTCVLQNWYAVFFPPTMTSLSCARQFLSVAEFPVDKRVKCYFFLWQNSQAF